MKRITGFDTTAALIHLDRILDNFIYENVFSLSMHFAIECIELLMIENVIVVYKKHSLRLKPTTIVVPESESLYSVRCNQH